MSTATAQKIYPVSAKLMAGEEAEAIVSAVMASNPAATVEDHGAYLALSSPGALVLDTVQIGEELGRPYDIPTLLVVLSSYTGQVEVQDTCLTIQNANLG